MTWYVLAAVLAATLLLILQGCSYLLVRDSAPHNRYAGVLTIFLASLGLVLFISLATGALVLGAEFRVVMTEGTPAYIGLAFLIIGLCVASGLGWQAARRTRGLPIHSLRILILSTLCGLLAALRIRVLISDDGVRCFDRWCPVLVIWLAICVSESLITLAGIRNRWARVWWGMLIPVSLALYVVYGSHLNFHYADQWSQHIWEGCLLLGLPAVMALGTFFAIEWTAIHEHSGRRWLAGLVSTVLGAAGLTSAAFWIFAFPRSPLPLLFQPLFLGLAWFVLLVLLVTARLYRLRRTGQFRLPDFCRLGWLGDVLALMALAALAAGFADALHFGRLEPVQDLCIMIFAWALLLELVGGGPLRALVQRGAIKTIESPLEAGARKTIEILRDRGKRAGGWLKWLFKAETKGVAILKVAAGVVLVVALFEIPNTRKTIVLPFNTPDFSEDEKKQRDLGREISDRIVNTLGLVGQELQPDMTIYSPKQSAPKMEPMSEEMGGLQAEVKGVDVDILGTKIPLGLLTVPIVEPMRWILGVREIHGSILRKGDSIVLLASSTKGETWRAPSPGTPESPDAGSPDRASKGASRKTDTNGSKPSEPITKGDSRTASANGPKSSKPIATGASPTTSTNGSNSSEPFATLADQIAYGVMSSDPALARFGMTRSPDAIGPFRNGVRFWKTYESQKDLKALSESIRWFREAVQTDPGFALAHYRLGRALAEDGQPGAATLAFRAALSANPRFGAAHIALANTYFGVYRHMPPPPGGTRGIFPTGQANLVEAEANWRQVVRLSSADASWADRAAAYSGLCSGEASRIEPTFEDERKIERTIEANPHAAPDVMKEWFSDIARIEAERYTAEYSAFFYCRRAEALYARLSPSLRVDSEVRTGEATALYRLGYTLELAGRREVVSPETGKKQVVREVVLPKDHVWAKKTAWHCSADTVTDEDIAETGEVMRWRLPSSLFGRQSLKYYRYARDLLPEDPVIGCAVASQSLSANHDPKPMQELEMNADAHSSLAEDFSRTAKDYSSLADGFSHTAKDYSNRDRKLSEIEEAIATIERKTAAEYYRLALNEYKRATVLAPMNVGALNNYAYTFWQWKQNSSPLPGPDKDVHAEEFARRAARLIDAAGDTSKIREAEVQSTLGEVLMGEGKPQKDIIEALQRAYSEVERSGHAYFNEIRLDLVKAYGCKSVLPVPELLEAIREAESKREEQPYTEYLKSVKLSDLCRGLPGAQVQDRHGTNSKNAPE
jgi:tetratricopeptide (TPR) repeat protein